MDTRIQTPGYTRLTPGRMDPSQRPLLVLIFNLESLAILGVNEHAVQRYGYSRKEFLTMTVRDLLPSAMQPALLRFVRDLPENLLSSVLCRHLKSDGRAMRVQMQCYKFLFQRTRAVIAISHEITQAGHRQAAVPYPPHSVDVPRHGTRNGVVGKVGHGPDAPGRRPGASALR